MEEIKNKKNYKDTLFMPETFFEMKADLVKKESYYQSFWLKEEIYREVLKKNKKNPRYLLHDGPPYANGNIHIGHALNKILKDFVVRYKSMAGFYSPFIVGWDCHGLPIENKMLAELKKTHKQLDVGELRARAKKYAEEQVEIQRSQFSRLLLLTDLKDFYLTLNPDYEARQLMIFKKMFNDGMIYRDFKPVYWSCSSLSALAEGEVEYKDKLSDSAYVFFTLTKGNSFVNSGDKLIIWTTQPWTLISNAAVALKKDTKYVLVECLKKNFIFAKNQLKKISFYLKKRFDNKSCNIKILKEFEGSDLLGLTYRKPILEGEAPVLNSEHADDEVGSGIVHISPAFGEEDFQLYKENNLEFLMHVNDDGEINQNGGEYVGLKYWEANKKIFEKLFSKGDVLNWRNDFLHSYPHDWRTNKPIIYRATLQWFVSIEYIKESLLQAAEEVKYYKPWAKKRLLNMLKKRSSWTISRQRSWGVPIPIFFDKHGEIFNNDEIFDHLINLFFEQGSDCWFNKSTDELLPKKYRGLGLTREKDIMDVWFDSGSSFFCSRVGDEKPPYELYLEGSDQFRGWFNSSIINSVTYLGKSPYKELLTHGFTLDKEGNKMSKSKGNVVDPLKICKNMGGEILRLWVAQNDISSDLSIGEKVLTQVRENYRKIRNFFRFLLGNLKNYSFKNNVLLDGVHLLFFELFQNLKFKILKNYENFEFHNVIKLVNSFITELSNYYFSLAKDIIYIEISNNKDKKQMLYNFYIFTEELSRLLAPILPVTMEEIYSHLNKKNKKISIHLENLPESPSRLEYQQSEKWKEFFKLKDGIYRQIEIGIKAGKFKRSAEVKVTIPTPSAFLKSLDLKLLFMVGELYFGKNLVVEKLKNYQKCERCWKFFADKDLVDGGEICTRCFDVVSSFENNI